MTPILILLIASVAIGVRSSRPGRTIDYRLVFLVSFVCAISYYSLRAV